MNLRKMVPWALVAVMVALLVLIAPRLQADGGPPSGAFTRPEPAEKSAAQEDGSAGVLPAGTKVEPVIVAEPAVDSRFDSSAGNSAGVVGASSEADQPAAQDQPAVDPSAAGLEAP